MKNKIVLTYGTYDLLHFGHLELLRRAKELGGTLIVGLSTDEFNALKHKEAALPFHHRKKILENLRCVDKVIPEHSWEQKSSDVKKYKADVFVMGDDWKGEFDFLKEYCEVVYLPRTPDISTTHIKNKIKAK